jgi:hypothetical protein
LLLFQTKKKERTPSHLSQGSIARAK